MTGAIARDTVTRRHAVGWGFVALGLVAVVAMEARGAAWSKHRGAEVHSLPHGVIVAGGVCAGVVAFLLFGLMILGARAAETPEQRRKRWSNAITFLVVIALISIGRLLIHPSHPRSKPATPAPSAGDRPAASSGGRATHTSDTWWPLVVVGLGTAAAFAAAVARRPGAVATSDTEIDAATTALLDASLDDLRREPDPRRAVIAAYARTERGLAARGFARQPSETPTEYLGRALGVEQLGVEPLRELTALAERARFSALPIDEAMRSRAIAALEALRREVPHAHPADAGRSA